MNNLKSLSIFIFCFVFVLMGRNSFARMASEEDMAFLKEDLNNKRVEVGITRLKDFVVKYGEPDSVVDGQKTVAYNYGDLKVEFEKKRYLDDWRYDSFKDAAYTDDIDTLRKDLESKEIDGEEVTLDKIKKDYKEPTESFPSEKDGEESIYYYGDIKLTFKNHFVVKSWKAKNLAAPMMAGSEETLESKKKDGQKEKK